MLCIEAEVQLEPRLDIPEEEGLTEPSIKTLAATAPALLAMEAANGGAEASTEVAGDVIRLGEEEEEEPEEEEEEEDEKDEMMLLWWWWWLWLPFGVEFEEVGWFVRHIFRGGEGGQDSAMKKREKKENDYCK